METDDFLFSILNNPIKWTRDVAIFYICEDKNMVIIYYIHNDYLNTAPEETMYDGGAL